jgi:type III pantothenate kinase
MLRALAENTAALKLSPGRYADFPTSTPDALATGVVQAVCGAIELMRARLASGLAVAVGCYIAGGAAREIAPHLAAPVQVVDNLVLEGVLALAGET